MRDQAIAVVNFDDLDLGDIDLFGVEVLDASDSTGVPEMGASTIFSGSCSCSCCWRQDDQLEG